MKDLHYFTGLVYFFTGDEFFIGYFTGDDDGDTDEDSDEAPRRRGIVTRGAARITKPYRNP